MVNAAVLINAKSGAPDHDDRVADVREALAAASLDARITVCEGARLTETTRALVQAGTELVIAAGGDGTVNAVASGLAGTHAALAVLPMGTLNHFAKDLGMPLALAEAARAITGGRARAIDAGEVNGQLFLNNSSIGLYPEMVMTRDSERRRTGRSKWVAMAIAALRTLRRFPLMSVSIDTPDRTLHAKTPFVFIGNNEYSTDAWTLGTRAHLDRGRLSLYTVRCRGRLHMFWLMVRAILQRLDSVRDFELEAAEEVVVRLRRRRLHVSYDGEVRAMTSPLRYRVRKGAVRVIYPPRVEDAMPEVSRPPRALETRP